MKSEKFMSRLMSFISVLMVVALSIPAFSIAQKYEAPDYAKIEKDIALENGDFYYPTLLQKLKDCDTTMTMEQLRALYYGSVFQKNYDPYKDLDVNFIISVINQEKPSKKDMQRANAELKELIEQNPTELSLYMYQFLNCLDLFGKESAKTVAAYNQATMLISAIESSGDGLSYESAFHIVNPDQSYVLMNIYGFSHNFQGLSSEEDQFYDVFGLDDNEMSVEKLYFNITPCFNFLRKRNANMNKGADQQKEVVIPINTAFTLELKITDNGSYQIINVDLKDFTDTLCWDDDTAPDFQSKEKNTIEGVFCSAKYCGNSEGKLKTVLIFRSLCKGYIEFDSFVQYFYSSDFERTSNSGAFSGARMTEMWSAKDNISAIRLGNFHISK